MPTLTPMRRAVAIVAGVVALQAVMLWAFAWPQANVGPRELPIAVAGPERAVEGIEARLAEAPGPDDDVAPFDVTTVGDATAAREAIEDRDVYGAIVVSGDEPELLVASAAGPAVAQLLRSIAGELGDGGSPVVEDVVPTDPDDPNGGGFAASVLPLVLTSAVGGLLVALEIRRTGPRLGAVVGFAVVAGLTAAAVLQYWLGIVDADYVVLAGAVALVVGAVAAAVAGLGAVLGRGGVVLGVLLMIFVGNPLSAATSAPQMLPQPWGDIGQLLPPGAGVSLVRSVAFFDGAGAAGPSTVLAVWLVAGLALVAAAAIRRDRAAPATVPADSATTA